MNACLSVGSGSVGETGATSLLCHTVGGATSKMVVLRRKNSSLCPNTGAVAVLSVNGIPVASGTLTGQGSSIQAEANPGDHVTAVVHTIPLFNNVVCIRLGTLEFQLDECDLVNLDNSDRKSGSISGPPPVIKDWYAWNDLMPPKPDVFHIQGDVQVSNLGVRVHLTERMPQGINPRILLLDLHLVQSPGIWAQQTCWRRATFEKVNTTYDSAEVFFGSTSIANVPADDIQ